MFKLLTCVGHFGHGSKAQFDSRIAKCYIHDIYRFVGNIFITIKPNFLKKKKKKKSHKKGERGFQATLPHLHKGLYLGYVLHIHHLGADY